MDVRNTIERMRRILLVASKPDKHEYLQSAKITGIGFVLIGFVGFIIFLIVQLIGGL